MYNENVYQRLGANIDSSLFPDQQNGIDALARLSSIILRLDIIDSMLMWTMTSE